MPANITAEVAKRLFILGVLAIVVVPRQHIDRTYTTIGGEWSHAFRKLLVISVLLNLIRFGASLQGHPWLMVLSDLLGIVEVVGLSFLCFYTPYILRKWLEGRINIFGRPDTPLYLPLQLTFLLCIMGVGLSRFVHPNFWCLKKLANIVSAPLVLQTIALYNSVTTSGPHHGGRGSIMAQTIMVVEYWHIVTQLLSALGYALEKHSIGVDDYNQWDSCLKAFRDVSFVSDWTRVCGHGIFINLLDEMALVSVPAEQPSATSNEGSPTTGPTLVDEDSFPLVPVAGLRTR